MSYTLFIMWTYVDRVLWCYMASWGYHESNILSSTAWSLYTLICVVLDLQWICLWMGCTSVCVSSTWCPWLTSSPRACLRHLQRRRKHSYLKVRGNQWGWELGSSCIFMLPQIDGFVQDCSISVVNTLEIPQSCTSHRNTFSTKGKICGLVQDCSNSSANALELL